MQFSFRHLAALDRLGNIRRGIASDNAGAINASGPDVQHLGRLLAGHFANLRTGPVAAVFHRRQPLSHHGPLAFGQVPTGQAPGRDIAVQ
jgi:hypothetical protein